MRLIFPVIEVLVGSVLQILGGGEVEDVCVAFEELHDLGKLLSFTGAIGSEVIDGDVLLWRIVSSALASVLWELLVVEALEFPVGLVDLPDHVLLGLCEEPGVISVGESVVVRCLTPKAWSMTASWLAIFSCCILKTFSSRV